MAEPRLTLDLDDETRAWLAAGDPVIQRAAEDLRKPLHEDDIDMLVRSALAFLVEYMRTRREVELIRAMNSLGLAVAGRETAFARFLRHATSRGEDRHA